jgi:uncharacterized protein (DUF1684 family)
LLDWRRRIFALYAEVRAAGDPRTAWEHWVAVRAELYRDHPQSPRVGGEPRYFDYDPAWRFQAEVVDAAPEPIEIDGFPFTRFAHLRFGDGLSLDAYWLETYGGGVFVPFRDGTSGAETYGGGRYVLDTVKGSDLGAGSVGDKAADVRPERAGGGALTLDFNFAYNPSCAWDPRWACPLTPPANRLAVRIEAGEQLPPP